jgi:hypothetical protein
MLTPIKGRGLTYSRIRVYQYLGSGYVEFRASFFCHKIGTTLLTFSALLFLKPRNKATNFELVVVKHIAQT